VAKEVPKIRPNGLPRHQAFTHPLACPLSAKALLINLLFPIQKSKIKNPQSSFINQSPSTRKTLENKIQSAFENKAKPLISFSISVFSICRWLG